MVILLTLPFSAMCAFGLIQLIYPKDTSMPLEQNHFLLWVTITLAIWFAFIMWMNSIGESSVAQKD